MVKNKSDHGPWAAYNHVSLHMELAHVKTQWRFETPVSKSDTFGIGKSKYYPNEGTH